MKNTRLLLGAALLPTLGAQAQERPNILYIMTDQQGPQVMSCAGNPDLHTPNMDMMNTKHTVNFCDVLFDFFYTNIIRDFFKK